MISRFGLFLVVALFAASSLQLGTLWVNNIQGNWDTATVQIERCIVDDNAIYVDFISELTFDNDGESQDTDGVIVEETNFKDGSVYIPVNLEVDEVGTIWGLLNANGGIRADKGDNPIQGEFDFSFKVEDDTGITTVNGELRPNAGINCDSGAFTVQDETGETTVRDALLRPNGGIDANDGAFTVEKNSGDIKTRGDATVEVDIIIGTPVAEDRYIKRVPTEEDFGADLIISGQGSSRVGGNLVLEPGYGESDIGSIYLGRAEADDLTFGRFSVRESGGIGGTTRFIGQSAIFGTGGPLYLMAGAGFGAPGSRGGDLVLAPGISTSGGAAGKILLGADVDASGDPDTAANYDLYVTRPAITDSRTGGDTYLVGQSAQNADAGDIYIRAGSSGIADGGDLYLQPGTGSNYGVLYLGDELSNDIWFTRVKSASSGGSTTVSGQSASFGLGGDLILEAGDGAGNLAGGDLYLIPGDSPSGTAGQIVWGTGTDDLYVVRPTAAGNSAGTATIIQGQNSESGAGGNVVVAGGDGSQTGGFVTLAAGSGSLIGGDIALTAGDGATFGGDIQITAGNGISGGSNGGSVYFNAGNGAATAGDIILNAGGANGRVIVTNSRSLQVDANVLINNADLTLQTGSCADPDDVPPCNGVGSLTVSTASPETGFLTYRDVNGNVQQILRSKIYGVPNVDNTNIFQQSCSCDPAQYLSVGNYIDRLRDTLASVVNAIGQCGHGLVQVTLYDGSAAYSDCSGLFPGPVPNPVNNQILSAASRGAPLIPVTNTGI